MNNSRTRKDMRHLARANELLDVGSSLGFGSYTLVKEEFVIKGKKTEKGNGVDEYILTLIPHKVMTKSFWGKRHVLFEVKSVKAYSGTKEADMKHLVGKFVTFIYENEQEENKTHKWSFVVDNETNVGAGWVCDTDERERLPFIGYTWASSKTYKDMYGRVERKKVLRSDMYV